jgi:hypothetical protein
MCSAFMQLDSVAFLGLDALLWAKLLVLLVILHLANTLYLVEVLGRAFDPYWKPRLYHATHGVREQYLATLYYAGAVLFRPVRKSIFGDNAFDFRGRVSRPTVALCLLHGLLLIAVLGLALVLAFWLAREGWAAWGRIPRPLPPPLPEPPPPG